MNGHAIIIISNNMQRQIRFGDKKAKLKIDWKILKPNKWGVYVPHEGDAPYPPYHALD